MVLFVDVFSTLEKSHVRLLPMAGEINPGPSEPEHARLSNLQEDEPVKKKSFFQITSVRSSSARQSDDGESFISTYEEDDVDEEGEDDDEPADSASLSENQGASENMTVVSGLVENSSQTSAASDHTGNSANPSAGNAGHPNGTAASSHSKFRVVRIGAKHVNKKYKRGRWSCWDYTDVQDAAQHSEHDRHTILGRSPCGSTTHVVTGEDPSSKANGKRKEVKFSVESVGESELLSHNVVGEENASLEVRDVGESAHNAHHQPVAAAAASSVNATIEHATNRHAHVCGEEVERDLDRFLVGPDGYVSLVNELCQ